LWKSSEPTSTPKRSANGLRELEGAVQRPSFQVQAFPKAEKALSPSFGFLGNVTVEASNFCKALAIPAVSIEDVSLKSIPSF